jgi:hypothetical protein
MKHVDSSLTFIAVSTGIAVAKALNDTPLSWAAGSIKAFVSGETWTLFL